MPTDPAEPTAEPTETSPAMGRPKAQLELPAVGQPVGRYMIVGELGAGAMGTVFLASDAQLHRHVALKLLTANPRETRLLDEARALARLQHPNVVAVHDVGWWHDQVYMAMEHVSGVSLATWLESHTDWKERLDAFAQAARGLAAAHRAGIIHHDVKPSNIMVGDDGRVRIVDFGLARSASPDPGAGSPGGTPRYMAPEQRRGEVADARADQFSLCVAIYESLFGTHPYAKDSPDEAGRIRVPAAGPVPVKIRDAVLKGLALAPADRHADMNALFDALALPRSRRMLWVAGGAAAIAIAATVVAVSALRREPPPAPPRPGKWDAILAASHLPPEQHEPLPGDPYQMTVHRLSNGLTVYISPNHLRPRVRTLLRFHAGTHDAPGVAAIAQGMAYKGTEKIGTIDYAAEKPHLEKIADLYRRRAAATDPAVRATFDQLIETESIVAGPYEITNEYSRIVQDFAIQLNNGRTGGDDLQFELDIASNRFAAWAELEGDRWSHPVLRQFRAQVADTMSWGASVTSKDGLETRMLDAVVQALFPGHPYGTPRRAAWQVMETEPYVEVEKFFHERFAPNNAELYIVGDVDAVTAIPILEKAFASWEPRSLPPRTRPPIPRTLNDAPVLVPSNGERRVAYAWRLPPTSSPDSAALYIANEIVRKLGDDPAIDFDRIFAMHDDAVTYVTVASPADGTSLEDAQRALDRLVQQVQDGAFSDEILDGAKRKLRVERLVAMRDNAKRAERFARIPFGVPWADRVALETGTDRVTRADVVRVARAYLGKPHATIRIEPGKVDLPQEKPPRVPPARFADQRSAGARALVAHEVVPIQPKLWRAGRDYEERTSPAGLVVGVTDRASELFRLHAFYNVGSAEIPGLCNVIKDQLHPEVASLTWRFGIQLNVTCGQRTLDIQLDGLDVDLPHAFEVLGALLEDPPPALWAQEANNAGRWITDVRGSPDYYDWALPALAMFGPSHPLFTLTDRSRYGAPNVAHDSMELLRQTSRAIGYYGPRSLDDVIALLPPAPAGPGAVPIAAKRLPATAPRVLVLDAPSLAKDATVNIVFGLHLRTNATAEQQVYELYWNPQDHPLALRLRGTAIPTFSLVRPWVARDEGWGSFSFRATGANAVSVIEQVLAEIPREPRADLLESAKSTWEGIIRSDWYPPESLPLRVVQWRLAGYERDPRQDDFERLPSLGKADYMKITAELAAEPPTITIWGNLAGVDRKALAKLGTVTELRIDDLFAVRSVKQP